MAGVVIYVEATPDNTIKIMHVTHGKIAETANMETAVYFIKEWEKVHPESKMGMAVDGQAQG